MKNKHIVLAGGSGFIGQAMATAWAPHNKVSILTRNVSRAINNSYSSTKAIPGVEYIHWDGQTVGKWADALEGCDILINLAGRSVNCRYNEKNKAEILNSRLDAVNVLGEAVGGLKVPPALFINTASATIYCHAEDRPQDELTGEMGTGFSVDVCKAWETAFNELELPNTRKVILRMAIVLGKGGVLTPYSALAKVGLGGRHGSGRQMFSWIHIDDVIGIIEWLDNRKDKQGIYNAAAPAPVANAAFLKMLRGIYRMPIGIPAPAWLLEIAALLHGTETELLLKSRWVIPQRLTVEGYIFLYPELKNALTTLLTNK